MPKHPLISIPLDVPDVRVLQTELTKEGELILTVESTLTSTTCRRCGRTISERHGVDEPRLLRHLPILGRVVYLRIRPKRFRYRVFLSGEGQECSAQMACPVSRIGDTVGGQFALPGERCEVSSK